MRYRFIGQYTLGRTSICMNGITFEGREPSEVTADYEPRFAGNIEFEAVPTMAKAADVAEPEITVAKRGRPKKVTTDG